MAEDRQDVSINDALKQAFAGADIDELQGLTQQIHAMFVGMGQRADSTMKSREQELQQIIRKKNNLVDTLQEAAQDLEQTLEKVKNQLAVVEKTDEVPLASADPEQQAQLEDYRRKMEALEAEKQQNQATLLTYEEKNRQLMELISQLRDAANEDKESKDLTAVNAEKEKLISDLNDREHEISNLKQQLQQSEKACDARIVEIKAEAEMAAVGLMRKLKVMEEEAASKITRYQQVIHDLESRMSLSTTASASNTKVVEMKPLVEAKRSNVENISELLKD